MVADISPGDNELNLISESAMQRCAAGAQERLVSDWKKKRCTMCRESKNQSIKWLATTVGMVTLLTWLRGVCGIDAYLVPETTAKSLQIVVH